MLKKYVAHGLVALLLASSAGQAQTVPNNGIPTTGITKWTIAQWITGWMSKVDVLNGSSTNQTLNNPTILGGTITPGLRTIIPLDVSTVTTGGTAVTAVANGHRTAGGFIQNPGSPNTVNLCINEIGGASGTTSLGNTTCISPGQIYRFAAASGSVSVVSSDSAHQFSGEGLQ